MFRIAIIGSGPAGFYTAEAALKHWGDEVEIDIFDALPAPYGLIRTGVAPDHQSIKAVTKRYEQTATAKQVQFFGNVRVGTDIEINRLRELYHAVVLATGAPLDKPLSIPGEEHANIFGSAAFVGWYNGHPNFADLRPNLRVENAVIIGMGNVALDVARILAKTTDELQQSDIVDHAFCALQHSEIRTITIVARRGPHNIMMTPKELGELEKLERAVSVADPCDFPDEGDDVLLEPGLRKSVQQLRKFTANSRELAPSKPITITFDFFAAPHEFTGEDRGGARVRILRAERTRVEAGKAVGTGDFYDIPADIVISCIGYRTSPIPGVPFDERAGLFANDEGRILPGLYCVGWARRGPSGTIGTNKPDGFTLVEHIAQDQTDGILGGREKSGRAGFRAYADEAKLTLTDFDDWKAIEQAEIDAARPDAPREKFVDVESMLKVVS